MIKNTSLTLIATLIGSLLITNIAYAKDDAFVLKEKSGVPKGFEDITQGHQLDYDILLNDRYIASILMDKKANIGFFQSVQGFSSILIGDQSDINFVLAQLKKENMLQQAMIYAQNENIIVLIDNKNRKITIKQKKIDQQLSPGESLSFRSAINGVYYENNQSHNSTINWNTSLSKGVNQGRITTRFVDENYYVDNAYYIHLLDDAEINIGVKNSTLNSFNTIDGERFLGISYLKKNQDKTSERKPIQLMLLHDAQVLIYKASELIYSARLAQGEQEIDTKSFPEGSYPIRIVIDNELGVQQEQNDFVSSSVSQESHYGFTGFSLGVKNTDQRYFRHDKIAYQTNNFIQAGYALPSIGNIKSYVNAEYDNHHFAINPTIMVTNDRLNIQSSYKRQDNDQWSWNSALFYRLSNQFFSLTYYRDAIQDNLFNADIVNKDKTTILGKFAAKYQYNNPTLGRFSLSYDKAFNQIRDEERYQLSHNIDILSANQQTLNLRTTFAYSDELFWGVELTYRLGGSGQYRYLGTLSTDKNNSRYNHQFAYQNRVHSTQLASNLNFMGGKDINNKSMLLNIDDPQYGYLNSQIGRVKYKDDITNYKNITFGTHLIGDSEHFLTTSKSIAKTSIAVDLTDYPKGQYILSFNKRRITVNGGSVFTIPVVANKKYKLSLSSGQNPEVKVSQAVKYVKLTEGNLTFISWKVDYVSLFYGRATYKGVPLKNALIKSSVSDVFTDENGYFTIELKRGEQALFMSKYICGIENVSDPYAFNDINCKNKK